MNEHPPVPGRLVTASVLMLSALTIMANATISPSLPGLKEHYADVDGIETLSGLLLSLPSLAIVLSAGFMGWMVDRFNRQTLLIVSALLYAIGGTSGLWVDSLQGMLIGRFILGLGVAGTMTLGMTWGADLWQGAARARFLGWQGASMSGGGIVVMLAGGALAALHWRGAFAVYALVLPVALLAVAALQPHARAIAARKAERATLSRAKSDSRFPWAAFGVTAPLGFFFMAMFYVLPTRGPFLMAEKGVTSPMLIAAIMAAMTMASVPGALNYGRIRRYLSATAIFGLSYVIMGAALVVMALATGPVTLLIGSLLMGIGMGPSMPNYTTFFMAFVPADLRGRASGLLTTAFFAGQFASPLISAPLIGLFGLAGAFEVMAVILMGVGAVILAVGLKGEILRAPVMA
jgi:MFS family permease